MTKAEAARLLGELNVRFADDPAWFLALADAAFEEDNVYEDPPTTPEERAERVTFWAEGLGTSLNDLEKNRA